MSNQFADFKSFIQQTFSGSLYQQFSASDRNCRGASLELYKLILKYAKQNPSLFQYITKLEIVSGMAHTFLRGTLSTNPNFFYLDPTIAQFVPAFTEGIFVGGEQELRQLAGMYGRNDILNDYIAIPGNYPPQVDTQLMNQAQASVGGKRKKTQTKRRKHQKHSTKRRKPKRSAHYPKKRK